MPIKDLSEKVKRRLEAKARERFRNMSCVNCDGWFVMSVLYDNGERKVVGGCYGGKKYHE